MEAFWKDEIIPQSWGNFIYKICSNCHKLPLEREEYEVYSPYCPWCGCKMTNAEEEEE